MALDAFRERVFFAPPDLIPADLRHAQTRGEASHATAQETEAGGDAELLRLLKEHLHADADAEQRCAFLDALAHEAVEAALRQSLHARAERADARQHEFRRPAQHALVSADDRLAARRVESLLDRAKVPHAVIYDRHASQVSCNTSRFLTATPPRPFLTASLSSSFETAPFSCSLQHALRARHALDTRVALDRTTERARRRLERAFEDVVRVAPAQAVYVKVAARGLGERAPEVLGQLDREVADHLPPRPDLIDEVEAARQVHDRAAQGLVHRHGRLAVARDSAFVAERLRDGLSERDGDVLDRVVVVYVQVAAALDFEVEQAVAREQLQHVIEERHARRDLRRADAVEHKADAHVRLLRPAPHLGGSRLRLHVGTHS